MFNNFMSSRGVETNPWNLPQQQQEDLAERYTGQLPDLIPFNNNNIPNGNDDDDDDFMSEDSEATTMMMYSDDDDYDHVRAVQKNEISSTTSTITTLNMINIMEMKRQNLWILQPALNSVYDNLNEQSPFHYKPTIGDYQMKIPNNFNNALLTPISENACFVQSRDICPIQRIQANLHALMLAMKNYATLQSAEKESLIINFNYLSDLIKKMEAGFSAQREWNLIIQSLFHQRKTNLDQTRDLESINLQHQVTRAIRQCPELPMNEQPPVTTLFHHYQQVTPSMENGNDFTENEINAQKMNILMTEIEEMMKNVYIM